MSLNEYTRIRDCHGDVLAHGGTQGKIICPFRSTGNLDAFCIGDTDIPIRDQAFKCPGILQYQGSKLCARLIHRITSPTLS